MSLGLIYKNKQKVFREVLAEVPYLSYPLFEGTGFIKHGFSTRLGGVSTGCYESMNLSFTRGDDTDAVKENFRLIGAAMGVPGEDMVFTAQTHTTNVKVATGSDRGMGLMRPLEYQDVDGLVTNVPGLCLTTFYADCVPLFFVDPVKKAIGLSHSGWRGTVGKIGQKTIELLQEQYGSRPEDILAAVGPSICQDCYEVSEDVIEKFCEKFAKESHDMLFYKKDNGKYQLDLWKANELIFLESGILPERIAVSNLCTCCNSNLLFSHRRNGDQRGSLAAFLEIDG